MPNKTDPLFPKQRNSMKFKLGPGKGPEQTQKLSSISALNQTPELEVLEPHFINEEPGHQEVNSPQIIKQASTSQDASCELPSPNCEFPPTPGIRNRRADF